MNDAIIIPAHNRLEYTRKVIPRLLEDPQESIDLYLWDNASTDETAEYLKSLDDPRIKDVYISKTNEGQVGAMNWAWSQTKADLVGKLDNDCLPTPGWTRIFAQAHRDILRRGVLAMITGQAFIAVVGYFLIVYYNREVIQYHFKEQFADISPCFFNALLMGIAVFSLSLLPIRTPVILLAFQILVGIGVCLLLSTILRLSAFLELHQILSRVIMPKP